MKEGLNNRLRYFRKKRKMTMVELAEKLNTSQPHIQMLETGKRGLTQEWMEKFAKVLGVRPEELLPSVEEQITVSGILNSDGSVVEAGQRIVNRGPISKDYEAIYISEDLAPGYTAGSIIACECEATESIEFGKAYLYERPDGQRFLRRIIERSPSGRYKVQSLFDHEVCESGVEIASAKKSICLML